MAKVLLQPIGSPLESFMHKQHHQEYTTTMGELENAIDLKRAEVKAGWGEEYVERVHKKGKMTAWERLEKLQDPGTKILPIGTFVNYGREFHDGS